MTEKMTNKKALTYVMENFTEMPEEVRVKLSNMLKSLENKTSKPAGERKPTARQLENENLKTVIVEFLNQHSEYPYSCTALINAIPELNGLNTQRVSPILISLKNEQIIKGVNMGNGKCWYSSIDYKEVEA